MPTKKIDSAIYGTRRSSIDDFGRTELHTSGRAFEHAFKVQCLLVRNKKSCIIVDGAAERSSRGPPGLRRRWRLRTAAVLLGESHLERKVGAWRRLDRGRCIAGQVDSPARIGVQSLWQKLKSPQKSVSCSGSPRLPSRSH